MTARPAQRRRPVRWLAAMTGAALAVGLLATQPTASAAATGGISGAVTNDADAPLAGIEVLVLDGIAETVVGSDTTDETGTYLVKGKSLRLTKKQAGKRLRVVVTASAPTHQPLTVRTKRTEKVKP